MRAVVGYFACVAAISGSFAFAAPQPAAQTPDQHAQAALRDLITGITRGKPNYDAMSADLAKQVTPTAPIPRGRDAGVDPQAVY
jgi:hypothetical protein